jgi:ParB-like chromosome segregation protein Spo0J
VTDSESGDRCLTRYDLSPGVLAKWEKNGWIKRDKSSDGSDDYSEATVEFVNSMLHYQYENKVDLTQAYQMAVKAAALKKRRNELAAETNEGDGKALKSMDPNKLTTYPTFENALTIDRQLLEDITRDMRHNGYRPSEPIALCYWEGLEGEVVHDGHTRRLAAIAAGIAKVPVVIEKFADEMAALEDFVKRQLKRRKNDPWVRFQMIIALDSVMERGGDRRSEDAKSKTPGGVIEKKGKTSAKRTATLVGCSPRMVDRVRRIRKAAKPEILEALKNRKMKISQAEQAIANKEKPKKARAQVTQNQEGMVKLTDENLAALKELKGTRHEHVNAAVRQYIARRGWENPVEQEETESDD